jgi:hypothetical protein
MALGYEGPQSGVSPKTPHVARNSASFGLKPGLHDTEYHNDDSGVLIVAMDETPGFIIVNDTQLMASCTERFSGIRLMYRVTGSRRRLGSLYVSARAAPGPTFNRILGSPI